MKKKLMCLLTIAVLAASVFCVGVFSSAFAAEVTAEKVYKDFPVIEDIGDAWNQFAWADANKGESVEMSREYSDQFSKDANMSLKIAKVNTVGSGQANVYYNRAGERFKTLKEGVDKDFYGVRFYVYSSSENSNIIKVKFGGIDAKLMKMSDEETKEEFPSTSLGFVGYRRLSATFPALYQFGDATEMQIMITGTADAEVYLSDFEIIFGEADKEEEAPPANLGENSVQLSGFNTQEEFDAWGLSGAAGTSYRASLNTDAAFIKEGGGSVKYEFKNETFRDMWTEIYLDIREVIQFNKDKQITGISFWVYSAEEYHKDDVCFWLKNVEENKCEYLANTKDIVGGTRLDAVGWRKVEIPWKAINRLASYSTDDNNQFDYNKLDIIKIGIRTYGSFEQNVTMYVDDVRLTANEEISLPKKSDGEQPNPDKTGCGSVVGAVTLPVCISAVILLSLSCFITVRKKRRTLK